MAFDPTTGLLSGSFDERKKALIDYYLKNQAFSSYNPAPGADNYYAPLNLNAPWAEQAIDWSINKSLGADTNTLSRKQMFDEERRRILADPTKSAEEKAYWQDRPIEAQWAPTEAYRLNPQSTWNIAPPEPGADALWKLGSLAAAAAGTMVGGPVLGGIMGGGVGTAGQSGANFGDILTGAAKGGAVGWAGGQIAQGIGNTVGYNPSIADATWSSTATPISQLGAQAGQAALTGAGQGAFKSAIGGGNIFEGALKGGVSGGVNTGLSGGLTSTFGTGEGGAWDKLLSTGGKALGSTLTSNLWGNAPKPSQPTFGTQPSNQSSGGGMPDFSNLSIGDIGGAVSPFLSAWNTNQQRGQTRGVYDQAMNLITQPSPDQQRYRTQLQTLMESPGSMQSSPLYQSMLESGTNAVNRSAAAKGMLGSGSRLADLMKSGQQTAAQYYFPQQQALAQLSGIGGDQASRAMGAQSLLQGNQQQNEMSQSMLKDLMGGFGVQTPQQQMIDALLGKTSGGTTGLGGLTVGAVKDWFNGSQSGDQPSGYDFNSPVFTDNMNWDNVFSNYNPSINYESPNIDLGANLGGTQSDYLQSLLNPSYDYNQSWF